MSTKKATIKDVCKETGLALGTVSKYLNGGKLKDENAELIEKAIKKLNYSVDIYARGMITKRTSTIGVVIPSFSNAFYGILSSEIGKRLEYQGYEMIVKESQSIESKELESIKWFIERRVDSIVCFSCVKTRESVDFYNKLDYKNIIFVDNIIDGVNGDYIVTNNCQIVSEVFEYLVSKKHKNIAAIFVGDNYYTSKERYKGFQLSCEKYKNQLSADSYFFDDTVEDAYSKIDEIIMSKKYSAIFAANYISTLGCIYYFNEKNISIPDGVSMVGFDNIMLTSLFKPKLTIVSQPIDQLAETTVNRIIEKIQENSVSHKTIVLNSTIIIGDTVLEQEK